MNIGEAAGCHEVPEPSWLSGGADPAESNWFRGDAGIFMPGMSCIFIAGLPCVSMPGIACTFSRCGFGGADVGLEGGLS